MKNLTKQFLILIFFFVLLLNCAFGQMDITVFNKAITLDAPMVKEEFPTGFPISLGAKNVRDCVARSVSSIDLTEIYDAVSMNVNQQNTPPGKPVLGAFFTNEYDSDTLTIIKSKTHGFCFAFHNINTLTLYYYELNENGSYDRIENLTTRINSYSENLFLSLHYSHFSPGSFPEKSTIFRFVCDDPGRVSVFDQPDLTIALSKDYKRQTGLFSMGMAQTEVLSGLESPNGGTSNCGSDCAMYVSNTHCLKITTEFSVTYECASSLGDCAAGAIEKKAKDDNINLGVPIRYKMMRDFRDKFMTKSCEGRKYIGFYYIFSKYAKMSIPMLWKYASLLPELYNAMENFSEENGNKIIVTPLLKEKVIEILHDHEDVGDDYFRSILKEVEEDMESFEGLKRSDLVALLSPYGSCSAQRIGGTDSRAENSIFLTVFENPGRDEIVVNYSVPGSSVKFELFNATAGLVTSRENFLPKQKFSIPASTLLPGVYICRISSDSGYEKITKVVVMQ